MTQTVCGERMETFAEWEARMGPMPSENTRRRRAEVRTEQGAHTHGKVRFVRGKGSKR